MSNEAWRNARAMYVKDTCAQALGIEIIEMDDGYSQMTMTVSPSQLNGHQTCHGGQLFSLADTAFAYACNSQGLAAVASAASIDFLRPPRGLSSKANSLAFTTLKLSISNTKPWLCFAANLTASVARLQEKSNA